MAAVAWQRLNTMPDTPDATPHKSPTRWIHRPWGVAALIVAMAGVLVMIFQIPKRHYERERRARREHLAKQIADVKAGKTSCIYYPDPEFLDDLVQDAECAEKLTEVTLGEQFSPDIAANRYQGLKQLPHLKTISVMYTVGADAFLEDIQGMRSLEELSFCRAGVTKAGARHLTSFPNLKRLHFDDLTDPVVVDVLKTALPNCKITR
jgi:hypothetical protein